MSAFALEDGVVCHTYSAYARGLDGLWGMYQWFDRPSKGRQRDEGLVPQPRSIPQSSRSGNSLGLCIPKLTLLATASGSFRALNFDNRITAHGRASRISTSAQPSRSLL